MFCFNIDPADKVALKPIVNVYPEVCRARVFTLLCISTSSIPAMMGVDAQCPLL